MQQFSSETVSSAFGVQQQDEMDESKCNPSTEFSFDESGLVGNLTSTPMKSNDKSNLYSDGSSPVPFQSPSFSPLSAMDSSESSPSHSMSDQEHTYTPNMNPPNSTQDPPQDGNNLQAPSQVKGVKIVGDNIDKNVNPRFMRSDHQGKSLHYFHCYAAQDRFDLTMPENYPDIPAKPKLEDLLPSKSDVSNMKDFFAIHVARILCKYMPFFSEDFGDVIPEHLEHTMSSQMSLKSNVVSMHCMYNQN